MYDPGTQRFKVLPRFRVSVRSSGEFLVYGMLKGKRVALLGPPRVSDRRFDFSHTEGLYTAIEIESAAHFDADIVTRDSGENLDSTPVAVPVSNAPPTLSEQVKALVHHELSSRAEQSGLETFEEADDFELDDDDSWVSPYEIVEMEDDLPFVDNAETDPAQADSGPGNGAPPPGLSESPPEAPSVPVPPQTGSHPLRRRTDLQESDRPAEGRRSTPP